MRPSIELGRHAATSTPPGEAAGREAHLWTQWREHRDPEARNELLALHTPYARVVAASYFAKRLNDEIEFSDYLQLASVGLIESFDRFDPAFGVQFRTFAARRMHGALLDGIEHMTEKQQQIAARQRLEEQRRAAIKAGRTGKGSRQPDEVLKYVAEAGIAFALAWLLDGTGMLHSEEKTETMPFYRNVELRQLRERIMELVRSLPPQERKVIQEHYFQEQPFDDIAEGMQLTKGRISQIHQRALLHLREGLQDRQDCNVAW